MTDSIDSAELFPELVARDKLDDHHRRQLSAMLDGELPPDQAKFMLRRLQHDGELAVCWERWQVCGDILRGRHDVLLPADFSQRVAQAIVRDDASAAVAVTTPHRAGATAASPRWLRWSGGALAASVALVALFFARQQAPDPAIDNAGGDVPAQIASATPSAASQPRLQAVDTAMADASTAMPGVLAPIPIDAASLAVAVAVADLPRRAIERRTTRAQNQRAALRLRVREDAVQAAAIAVAASAPAATDARGAVPVLATASTATVATDPFAALPLTSDAAPSRPWPRAIMPGYSGNGAFTASYGSTAGPSFHPFEPQLGLQVEPSSDADPNADPNAGPPDPH
ncbi:MAG: sigma-E factor negative regulatory protein [Luteimonas sp.]